MKTIIYCRCSTDEKRQTIENQLIELRRYCQAYNMDYDEEWEYESGYKGVQPKLKQILEKIRKGIYKTILVYDLSRFSREHPKITDQLLNDIVYRHKCRFISLIDGLDSGNEMTWHIVRPLFQYFAYVYSRNLSIKIKGSLSRAKDEIKKEGFYKTKKGTKLKQLGRPGLDVDKQTVIDTYNRFKSLRKAATQLNVSYGTVYRVLKKQ